TFRIRFPAAAAPDASRGDERPVVLLAAPPEQVPVLRARLEREGLVVIEALGTTETIRRARRHRPDAVVLALVDGAREVLSSLRQDAETERIPVIAMVDGERRGEQLALADLVVGPAEEMRLAAAIRRLLGRGVAAPDRPPRVMIVDDEPAIVDFT